ncbi:MAG: Hsp33 family molecular chaperone HslO [Lysobacter spongiicola]|nr:Hsp33 family molecular chaperone HslO [Lysobacter spongiicola]
MTSPQPSSPTPSEAAAGPDTLTRFLIDGAGVRGVRVHLQDSWQHIRSLMEDVEAQAPAALELLGEALAASALFTGHAKVDGRLSVQLKGTGTLRTLFAECTAAGDLRGIVRLAEDGGAVPRDLRHMGPGSMLAITIENPGLSGREPNRYQGLVSLESESLAGAFEDYFRQSEQLPTRLLLAGDHEKVAGLMLQKLPGDEGDDDGWARAGALFDTLTSQELLELPADTLLTRLFHEDGVRTLGDKALRFACSCSKARVESMLVSLGEEEAMGAVIDGEARIRCEFCGQRYSFSAGDVRALLDAPAPGMEAPDTLQ